MARRSSLVWPWPNIEKKTLRGLPSIGSGCSGVRNEMMPPGSPHSSIDGSGVSLPRCRAAIWSTVTPTPVAAFLERGLTALSQVSSMIPWGFELSPPLLRRPLTTVTCSRSGARGSRMNGNSKFLPTWAGSHSSCSAPCGKYTKPRQGRAAAAVFASAVPAGIIASSNGSAIEAPAPCNSVRRDKCFRVRNIASPPVSPLTHRRLEQAHGFALTESVAHDDADHYRLETVVIVLGLPDDLADRRHIAVVETAAQRILEQVLGERPHESIGLLDERPAQ